MNPLKAGDTVICKFSDGWLLIPMQKRPQAGQEYIVSETDGNYISLAGLDPLDMWHIRNFEQKKSLTRMLADQFMNHVEERSDYERIFKLDADF